MIDRGLARELWEKVWRRAWARLAGTRLAGRDAARYCVRLAIPARALFGWRLERGNPLPALVSGSSRMLVAYLLPGEEALFEAAVAAASGLAKRTVESAVHFALQPLTLTWRDLQALKLCAAGYAELLATYPVARMVRVAKVVGEA